MKMKKILIVKSRLKDVKETIKIQPVTTLWHRRAKNTK